MALRRREPVLWAACAALLAAAAGWFQLGGGFAFTDYDLEAAAAVRELLAGDVAGFLAQAPSYGGSLLLRSPALLAVAPFGGGETAAYVAMAVLPLLALVALAAGLAVSARRGGAGLLAAGGTIAVVLLNPASAGALAFGHAEEALGAVLVVAAAVTARRGRWALSGVLLGIAVANKPWAAVAVAPVLLALPRGALRAGAVATLIAGAVMLPLLVSGGAASRATRTVATDTGTIFKTPQVWWFAGRPVATAPGARPGARVAPAWLSRGARPLLVVVSVALALLWRARRRPTDALGLLALVLFARCLLDPWDNVYYHLPFLLALAAWEVLRGRRFPWAALAAVGLLRMTVVLLPTQVSADTEAAAYLAWALPGIALLGLAVLAPARARRLQERAAGALRHALPTLSRLGRAQPGTAA